jgi:hypothetical protein
MMNDLHEMLNKIGVNADDLRAEEFAGYWSDLI